ncbi:MAG: hypothetical protein IT557_13090 [Alphaproteobacteria bacterium]|nr:hypothetical protein [Alphaproteobacteria bacterium]
MTPTQRYAAAATQSLRPPPDSDPRAIEAWALAEAGRRLIAAARAPIDEAALRVALQLNQRLWTMFQAAMAEADCPLPLALRQNVLRLSLLVDAETLALLAEPDPARIERLVAINRAVAEGLMQRPPARAA